jgi:hemoglobin
MRIDRLIATGLLFALCACSSVRERPLYDQLGGQAGIEETVALLLERIADDPRIAHHFAGIDVLNLNDRLVEQLCFEAGGPCRYEGKDMVEAHAHLDLDTADFNALVEDLMWAMDRQRIPRTAQNRLLKRLAPMHRDVVGP